MSAVAAVLGAGHVVVDHVVWLPAYPAVDSKSNILRSRIQVGGPVPTALVLLARWGQPARFLGVIGDDADGLRIVADLQREGVDPTPMIRRQGMQTGFAHVWVEQGTGRRTVASYRPEHPVRPDELPKTLWDGIRLLHLDGWPGETAVHAAASARALGIPVSLDAGSVRPEMDRLLPLVDVLTAPERFARDFCRTDDVPAAARALLAIGPHTVYLTRDAAGARAWMRALPPATEPGAWTQPALDIAPVDTNGAGDTFAGAVLYGTLHGWPVPKTLQTACVAAGLKCARSGNRDALPALSDVLARLE
jgi:sugar/nucleoside kinase (ribokinase family)